jgi:hypothetical protein
MKNEYYGLNPSKKKTNNYIDLSGTVVESHEPGTYHSKFKNIPLGSKGKPVYLPSFSWKDP